MDILSSSQSTAQTYGATAQNSQAATDRQALASDFETFLKMLTAQMKNQDPLNPVDSNDFATQLATFSGVEQQVKTNDLLAGLKTQMMTASLADMSGWVGMEARTTLPVEFSGAPIELIAKTPQTADTAELIVKDDQGNIVQRLPVSASETTLSWAGVSEKGAPFKNGIYSFEIEAFSQGSLLGNHTPESYQTIHEMRVEGEEAFIVLSDLRSYPAHNVTGLRSGS